MTTIEVRGSAPYTITIDHGALEGLAAALTGS